jgi:hypothetical protein
MEVREVNLPPWQAIIARSRGMKSLLVTCSGSSLIIKRYDYEGIVFLVSKLRRSESCSVL